MPDRAVDGSVLPLILIKRVFPLKYCPLANSEFYHISYTVVPEEDTTNYCPQDTTDFYTFASEPAI